MKGLIVDVYKIKPEDMKTNPEVILWKEKSFWNGSLLNRALYDMFNVYGPPEGISKEATLAIMAIKDDYFLTVPFTEEDLALMVLKNPGLCSWIESPSKNIKRAYKLATL